VRTEDAIVHMRWGIIPVGRVNARGRPVMETLINARSETVFSKSAFAGVRRCIVPLNGWYEWTGEKRKKTAWRIVPKAGGLLAFAAIYDVWTGPGGIEVPQVATVTCEPSADVRDIHHRMGVLLEPDQFKTWLTADETDLGPLMQPYPDGMLNAEIAEGVDWDGP
jgi:putative SOS response-associated peptidase YedK